MNPPSKFSKHSVWQNYTPSGFRQQVFYMFHGTKSYETVLSILKNGFYPSDDSKMLGEGIYLSHSLKKALAYGKFVIRVLVYPGYIKTVTQQGDKEQKTWQYNYTSCWVPPKCGMVPSGLPENCVKSKHQIHILGVFLVDDNMRYVPRNKFATKKQVHYFTAKIGLKPFFLFNVTKGKYLSVNKDGRLFFGPIYKNVNSDAYAWTRSWDNCIESMNMGQALTYTDGELDMTNQWRRRGNKWKLLGQGYLVNKGYGRDDDKNFLCVDFDRDGTIRAYLTDRDNADQWRFVTQ